MPEFFLGKCFVAIFSDIHLGSRDSQPEVFLRMLDAVEAEIVLINGDLMDRIKLKAKKELEVLDRLKLLGQRCRVHLGNHDPWKHYPSLGLDKLRLAVFWHFSLAGKRFYIHHGHRWDNLLQHHPLLVVALNTLYWLVKPFRSFYQRYVLNGSIWSRISRGAAHRALRFGFERNYDVVIGSHTHQPLMLTAVFSKKVAGDILPKRVLYVNTGSVTDEVCQLTTISYHGEITIHHFSNTGKYLGTHAEKVEEVVVDLAV